MKFTTACNHILSESDEYGKMLGSKYKIKHETFEDAFNEVVTILKSKKMNVYEDDIKSWMKSMKTHEKMPIGKSETFVLRFHNMNHGGEPEGRDVTIHKVGGKRFDLDPNNFANKFYFSTLDK